MSSETSRTSPFRAARVLIIGLTVTVAALAIALVIMVIARPAETPGQVGEERVNVLANSDNDCVSCHVNSTPGIVEQYGHSSMAAADVTCEDCHVVDEDYPGATEHEGTFVLQQPTTAMCQDCHNQQVAQFNASRHSLPSYVAYAGTDGLSDEHRQMLAAIPEAGFSPEGVKLRNALHEIEGEAITKFACERCHDVGKPAEDGSVGQCSSCHIRHEFSLEQARKPETCNACHIGPDHPQWEIYQESPHGILYATDGDNWDWEAEPGTLGPEQFPAPTCATCHLSGFGSAATTHDVGERLTWFLYAPISQRRPSWQDNMVRMQGVCRDCHNEQFIDDFYTDADAAVEQVNAWVVESNEVIQPLTDAGLLTDEPFDEPIDFTHFELWHHWGRTAKFGVWMQGADYVQWHGAYELLADMAELREMVADKLELAELAEGEDASVAAEAETTEIEDAEAAPASSDEAGTDEPDEAAAGE